MSKFFLNKRSWKVLVAFLMVLGLCTVLSACSDDDELANPSRASILVTHEIASGKVGAAARALGSDIHSVVYYCYNSQGVRTFGPAQLVKAHQILLQAVPVESTSIGMTYYNSDGKALAYYSQPVSLKVGEVYEVTNPEWKYLDEIDNMVGLEIAQDDMRLHPGDDAIFYALAFFKDSESGKVYPQLFTGMCDWKSNNTAVASLTKQTEDGEATLGNGKFYTLAAGSAEISASFQSYTDTVTLNVTDADITEVKFAETELTLPLGLPSYECPLTATWSDGETTDVSYQSNWSSSNIDRVLASYGAIFPRSCHETEEQPTTITATCTSNGNSYQAQCKVTVVEGTFKSLSVALDPETLYVGETSFIDVYAKFAVNGTEKEYYVASDSGSYTVTSSKPEVAAIEPYGTEIKGLTVGTTDLIVNFASGDIKDSAKTTVSVVERDTSGDQDTTGDATGDNTGDEGGEGSGEGQDGGDIDIGNM